jgi:hypothetical protein
VTAVPGDQVGGGQGAGQLLAGDAEVPVDRRAVRVDHGVDVPAQLVQADVDADVDVADEADAGLVQRAVQRVPDGAHLGVVRGDAVPDQAERGGQPVDQVDRHGDVGLPGERVGGVDAGRAGADHRDAQRPARC